MLSIALTKGRLEKQSVAMFEECGYGIEQLKDKGKTAGISRQHKRSKIFFGKSCRLCDYVEHGVADVGFVGKDTLMEADGRYYELLDLGIGKCGFIVAGLPGKSPFEKLGHVKIGSKYPHVARDFFKKRNMDVEVIKIEGSVELAPILGLCDGIVDIMETGTTLRENGLVVYERICDISARVIVNRASFKLKQKEIMTLLNDLTKVRDRHAETNGSK